VPKLRGEGTLKNVSAGSVLLTASAVNGIDGMFATCGLVIVSVAVRNPLGPAAGPKITWKKHDAPPATVNGGRLAQDPLLTEKSVVSPVMFKPLTVAAVVVGLLSIMFFKLEVPEVPIATGPIAIEVGETFNAFVPATVPVI
jgi:hypothetical protein